MQFKFRQITYLYTKDTEACSPENNALKTVEVALLTLTLIIYVFHKKFSPMPDIVSLIIKKNFCKKNCYTVLKILKFLEGSFISTHCTRGRFFGPPCMCKAMIPLEINDIAEARVRQCMHEQCSEQEFDDLFGKEL